MERKSDWCSGWFDRWEGIDFSECCCQHDIDYAWIKILPSTWQRVKERYKADYKLMKCVRDKGLPPMGLIMFVGVRTFGWPVVHGESTYKKENENGTVG